jgi:hypothetical protein
MTGKDPVLSREAEPHRHRGAYSGGYPLYHVYTTPSPSSHLYQRYSEEGEGVYVPPMGVGSKSIIGPSKISMGKNPIQA